MTQSISEALREIASRLDTIDPHDLPRVSVGLDFQPAASNGVEATMAAVDTLGRALFGLNGCPRLMLSGSVHHHADGHFGPVHVRAYGQTLPADPTRARTAAEAITGRR